MEFTRFGFGKAVLKQQNPAYMLVEKKHHPLRWGALDLALFGLQKDWYGTPIDPPAAFGMAMDHADFWFVATRRNPPFLHPDARPGKYLPELWKYDVAEFFISHPESGRYLEFNLAPNGAWWSAEFTAPRVRASADDVEMPGVKTFSDLAPDGTWIAAASIPLDILQARLNFGEDSRMNVTMIVDSPEQRFLTANSPTADEPDFHQPDLFQPVRFHDGGLTFHETNN